MYYLGTLLMRVLLPKRFTMSFSSFQGPNLHVRFSSFTIAQTGPRRSGFPLPPAGGERKSYGFTPNLMEDSCRRPRWRLEGPKNMALSPSWTGRRWPPDSGAAGVVCFLSTQLRETGCGYCIGGPQPLTAGMVGRLPEDGVDRWALRTGGPTPGIPGLIKMLLRVPNFLRTGFG